MTRKHGTARAALALLLGIAFAPTDTPFVGQDGGELEAADLEGVWSGEATHNEQSSAFAVRFVAVGGGGLGVRVSLPAIDAWDVDVGAATISSNTVSVGSWTLDYDAAADTLAGDLPHGFVPVHAIPVVLTRTDELPHHSDDSIDVVVREPEWRIDTGGPIWAGLAFDDGVVYAASDTGTVHALSATDGGEHWRFDTAGPVRAAPVADGDALYVHSDDGALYRLDRATGRRRWRAPLSEAVTRLRPNDPRSRYDNYASSPTVRDGTVFVGSANGIVRALEAASGRELWRFAAEDTVTSMPLVAEGRVVFGSFDGHVYALDASDGQELWRFDTHQPVPSSAAVLGGTLLIGSRSYDLFALRPANGTVAWKHYVWFSWIESTATVHDEVAYVGSSDAQLLVALGATTRRPQWQFDTGGSAWARPAVSDAAVYVGAVGVGGYFIDHRGGFYAVDRRNGQPLWQFPTERPLGAAQWGFAADAAVGSGQVFAGGLDGVVYAFEQ